MNIFKTYFRLVRHFKWEIIVPLIIFVAFSFLSKAQAQSNLKEFQAVVPGVAIINKDTTLGKGLMEYLDGKVILEDIPEDSLEEAIFYHQVSFTLVIPEGYTQSFLENGTTLVSNILPDSSKAYIAQSYIDDYLSYYKAFSESGYEHQQIQSMIMGVTAAQPEVKILDEANHQGSYTFRYFSNMSIYPIFITMMSILIPVLMAFNKEGINRRTVISSQTSSKKNGQLFLGTLIVGHALWGLMMTMMFFLMQGEIQYDTFPYALVNSYSFFLVSLSMAFLASKIVKTSSAQSALTNSIGLGLSFISGVFVPREFLGAGITNLAKVFPFYWNVEANELIFQKLADVQSLALPILIQILFAIVIFLLTLTISRNRRFA